MKSYKVRREFAGLKEGGEVTAKELSRLLVTDTILAILLALGFIEETGKIAQEVGGEKKEVESKLISPMELAKKLARGYSVVPSTGNGYSPKEPYDYFCSIKKDGEEFDVYIAMNPLPPQEKKEEVKCVHDHAEWQIKKYGCETSLPPQNEWRPEEQEIYWYCDSTGRVFGTNNDTTESDNLRIALGNYFRTESAALRAAEEIRNLLKTLPKE